MADMVDDESLDLDWHALNYRNASIKHAELMWQELVACVDRKIAAERERCALSVIDYALSFSFDEDVRSLFSGCAQYVRTGIIDEAE